MPKKQKDDANAEKDIVKKALPDEAQSQEKDTSSVKEDSISKVTPTQTTKNDHRFHKVVEDGKSRATKVLYKKRNESRDNAVSRLKESGWMDDNTAYHFSPDENEIHEGDSSKCPNCIRYSVRKSDGPEPEEPEGGSRELRSTHDVSKAWTTIPANTVPYLEFNYWDKDSKVVLPLFSGAVSIDEALVKFRKAQEFMKIKPELKVRISGKIESHLCPNAYEVKVTLSRDMRSILPKQSISGWAPILMSSNEELKEKRLTLKPRLQVVYTPQVVNLKRVDLLKDAYGLKDAGLEPNEDFKGDDTTEKTDE